MQEEVVTPAAVQPRPVAQARTRKTRTHIMLDAAFSPTDGQWILPRGPCAGTPSVRYSTIEMHNASDRTRVFPRIFTLPHCAIHFLYDTLRFKYITHLTGHLFFRVFSASIQFYNPARYATTYVHNASDRICVLPRIFTLPHCVLQFLHDILRFKYITRLVGGAFFPGIFPLPPLCSTISARYSTI
jgi:hypothetical protein